MTDGSDALADELEARLADADAALAARYPGDRGRRQPVHTVYVPADCYDSGTVRGWAEEARQALDIHGGSETELAEALDLQPSVAAEIYQRILRKLAAEPVEDLRIDFEDGYGIRPDEDEDAGDAPPRRRSRPSIAAGERRAVPRNPGQELRGTDTRARGRARCELFVATLVEAGGLTDGFVVTLPEGDQGRAGRGDSCSRSGDSRTSCSLEPGALRFEIQVETPQAVLGPDGTALVARMVHAGGGRLTGLHYGTYDYSASLGIAAEYQSLEHPVADHAKVVMQAAAAGTGVRLSDGSTNVLPVGDADAVHAAWRHHLRLVRRSLERGIYQGWDMHPAQLAQSLCRDVLLLQGGAARCGRAAPRICARRAIGIPRRACHGGGDGRILASRPRVWRPRCG